jgi:hypothetical protein
MLDAPATGVTLIDPHAGRYSASEGSQAESVTLSALPGGVTTSFRKVGVVPLAQVPTTLFPVTTAMAVARGASVTTGILVMFGPNSVVSRCPARVRPPAAVRPATAGYPVSWQGAELRLVNPI